MKRRIVRALALLCIGAALVPWALLAAGCAADQETTTLSSTTTVLPTTTTSTSPAVPGGSLSSACLVVHHGADGEASGAMVDFTVSIEPNANNRVSVGIQEKEVAGAGEQTRASVWASCLAATSLLNLSIGDFRFNYDVGWVDGPSAGGIYTAAALAVLLGDEFRPDVAMTGAINPDFSIGPVGGIPQKLEGAAAEGKTVVLVPRGQRYNTDAATGEYVDVVQKGQSLGIDVEEVGNIFEAYQLLTGEQLPQPEGNAEEPEVGTTAYDVLFSQTASWLSLTEERLAEYSELPDDYKTDYEEASVEDARALAEASNKYLAQGMLGPGYFSALESYRFATQAYNYVVTEEGIRTDGEEATATALAGGQIHDLLAKTQDGLLSKKPANVAQALALMEAWGRWTAASGLVDEADRALAAAPQGYDADEDSVDEIYLAVFNYTKAYRALWAAADAVELGDTLDGAPIASTKSLEQLAEAYRLASDANLETIRALVVAPMAQNAGVSEAEARATLAFEDDSYAEAYAVQAYYSYLNQVLPEGPERAYAVLGAALTAFTDSAVSLADHYSYVAERDEDGAIVGFAYEKALIAALDFARERARLMIAQAAAGGNDAALPVLYYQNATLEREGDPADKLASLYDYWTAGLYARVAGVLSGSLEPLAPRR